MNETRFTQTAGDGRLTGDELGPTRLQQSAAVFAQRPVYRACQGFVVLVHLNGKQYGLVYGIDGIGVISDNGDDRFCRFTYTACEKYA
jgi:hypothetical protein